MSAPRAVLIVRLSSIGDVIHALPAYVALRRAWPETAFGWAVEPAAADLVRRLPVRVHPVDTPSWKRRPLAPATHGALRRLRRELRDPGYDLAVDLQGLLKSAVVARLAGPRVLGYGAPDTREPLARWLYRRRATPAPRGCHMIERGLHLAAFATGRPTGPPAFPTLHDRDDDEYVDHRLADGGITSFVLLHCAANWPSKRYPAERWIEIGRALHARTGEQVLWSWGPGEEADVAALAARAGSGNRPAFPTRLPQLAALVARARLVVGGDSAPLHLAVACRTPVVGLFGPTDPGRTGPLDPADGVVRRVLPCSHCHARRCPLGTRECLESIQPESVVEAVIARLARAAG